MATLDAQNKAIIDAIAAATGMRSALTTTDKTTFVAAINEIKAATDALGTVEHTAADITARDALTGLIIGDRVFVTDASSEGDVDSGWAIYRVNSVGPNTWVKIAEQESLDVVMAANLAAGTHNSDTLEITIDTGTNIVLPKATPLLSGLMSGADKTEHDRISSEVTVVNNEDYTTYVNSVM